MTNDEKILQIKKDLRHLRKITHSIEVSLEVEQRHIKRLAVLKGLPSTKDNLKSIQSIEEILKTLNIQEFIKEGARLESRYIAAINRLDPLDKVIILDGYINGKAYWKIGRDIGYTEVGIQKRVVKIIEKIASFM